MLGAQTPSAQVEAFWLTIYSDSNRMNIGHPATLGVTHGVAYIMAELGRLPTQIALQYFISFTDE